MNTNPLLEDRFAGVLFGQAVGDALGLGTEFMSKREVVQHYPQGLHSYAQMIQDAHRRRWKQGAWTDDTDQMTMILDSLLEMSTVDVVDIARRFWNWVFVARGEGIGYTTYQVLSHPQFAADPHSAATAVWEESNRNLAANGGLMRTSVVGLWDFHQRANIQANAEAICRITHADPRCIGSCVVTSVLINELVKGRLPYADLFDELTALADQYDPRIRPCIETTLHTNDIASLDLENEQDMGYTLKTLATGIWALTHADSFAAGLSAVIHEGGDADTNGAVAGALLGARFGKTAIPREWLDGLLWKMYLERVCGELLTRALETAR